MDILGDRFYFLLRSGSCLCGIQHKPPCPPQADIPPLQKGDSGGLRQMKKSSEIIPELFLFSDTYALRGCFSEDTDQNDTRTPNWNNPGFNIRWISSWVDEPIVGLTFNWIELFVILYPSTKSVAVVVSVTLNVFSKPKFSIQKVGSLELPRGSA